MLFNSYEFLFLFLPVTLAVFFWAGKQGNRQLAIGWLVAASLFFYGWWNPPYLFLMIFSIIFNYGLGNFLGRDSLPSFLRRGTLALGVAVNLGLIGYYKYANFFVDTVNHLAGTSFNLEKIILPLAISFFTFQQISYLVDSYKGETKNYNFLQYCLFVSFFPQLIAGPIVLHDEIMPQFSQASTYRYNREDMAVGLTIFSMGLFKKVILADTIALYATPVFNAAAEGTSIGFFEGWCGALAYTMQLYFDFSGYSDMAIGAARMFGITLPLNFNSPYKAVNISDFWRRWHITLSRFLRDYIYIPLGGNRKGKLRRYTNLLITMLLGGLWHGAGWTYVFWGGLHGIYLVVHQQWQEFRKTLGHDLKKSSWWSRGLSCLVTFSAVVVSWVFFRAESMTAAVAVLKGMVGINGISLPGGLSKYLSFLEPFGVQFYSIRGATGMPSYPALAWLCLLLLITWLTPNVQEWMERYRPALNHVVAPEPSHWLQRLWHKWQWQPSLVWSVVMGIATGLSLVFLVRPTEFLYFQF